MSSTAEQWAAQGAANATARAKKGVLPNGSVSILRRMLSKYWVGPGEQNNLVSYDGGRWYVPRDVMEVLYNKSMWWLSGKNGQQDPEPFGLIEQIAPAGKLFFDLDGKVELAEQGEIENEWRIGQVIERVVNRCFVRENKPLEVYISRSSVVPNHKMHFAIPSITLGTGVKAAITEMLRAELNSAGMVRAAEALDAKCVRGLRMRHTMKVDWKNGDFEWLYEKGRYPDWNVVYPEKGPPVKQNRFRMCLMAWLDNGDTLTPTRDGLVVPELKPKYNDRLDACVFTYEDREEAAHIIAGLDVDECLKPKGWKGTVFVFDRVKPGPCPCGSGAVHDRRGAYAVICAQGDMIRLRCSFDATGQCGSRVLWRRERDVETPVDEDRWPSNSVNVAEDNTWEPNRLTQLLANSGWIVKGLEPDPQNCSEDAVELVASKDIECRCCEKMLAVGDRVFVTQNEDEYWGGCLDNDGTRVCTRAQMEATEMKSDSEDDDSSDYESESEVDEHPVNEEKTEEKTEQKTEQKTPDPDPEQTERVNQAAAAHENAKAAVNAARKSLKALETLRLDTSRARVVLAEALEKSKLTAAAYKGQQSARQDKTLVAPTHVPGVDFELGHVDVPRAVRQIKEREGLALVDIFVDRVHDSIKCLDVRSGEYRVWSNATRLWEPKTHVGVALVLEGAMRWARPLCDGPRGGNLLDHRSLPGLEKYARERLLATAEWIDELDSKSCALACQGGLHVDLRTGLSRLRQRDDMWTKELNVKLLPLNEQSVKLAIAYVKSVARLKTGEYSESKYRDLCTVIGRLPIGDPTLMKELIVLVGKSDAGKTIFLGCLGAVLQPGVLKESVLSESQYTADADPNRHDAGLMPMVGRRWARFSETKTIASVALNVQRIDNIVGEKRLQLRNVGARSMENGVRHTCQPVLNCNKVPSLPEDPEDRAKLLNKLFLVELEYAFKKNDPKGLAYIASLNTQEFRDQTFTLMVMCARDELNKTPEDATFRNAEKERLLGKWTVATTQRFVGICIDKCGVDTCWLGSSQLMDVYRWWCDRNGFQIEKSYDRKLTALLGAATAQDAKGLRGRLGMRWSELWLATLTEAEKGELVAGRTPSCSSGVQSTVFEGLEYAKSV